MAKKRLNGFAWDFLTPVITGVFCHPTYNCYGFWVHFPPDSQKVSKAAAAQPHEDGFVDWMCNGSLQQAS